MTVCCRRYAVEDAERRLTLDCEVITDTGKTLPASALEFKAIDKDEPSTGRLVSRRGRSVSLNPEKPMARPRSALARGSASCCSRVAAART